MFHRVDDPDEYRFEERVVTKEETMFGAGEGEEVVRTAVGQEDESVTSGKGAEVVCGVESDDVWLDFVLLLRTTRTSTS